ncbi:alpha/beta hydrolase [Lacisediminihabitans profunda]|uniref:Alpha/beta hydrolase n=1 Tax=Lacisediminihabitans profunda TaxID=2594790 RepID=A0A5C8UMG1_9MICO|nr:alpha/beta hydrolase [Lacisediminihabitans profunda]TXN29495.1 alpha/beta hydrolase [Lacisediminihabitans profunda]
MTNPDILAPLIDVIRSLEDGTSAPDPRTDIDTASLVARYPELGTVTIRDVSIPTRHGDIPARLYRPEGMPKGGLVWAHGGSFIGGNLDMPEAHWVSLAVASRGFAVLSVEYTKALHGVHFPAPSIDLLEAWNWAVDNLGVSLASLHLGGASAGANLAAGVGVRLRDGQGKLPASLVLVYPQVHTVLPEGSAAARAAAETVPAEHRFPQTMVSAIAANYLGSEQDPTNPYAYAGSAELAGMPPMFILNSERDEHRYSGEEFARQAMDAGVWINVVYEPGSTHGHLDRPHTLEAQRSIARMAHWLDGFPTEPLR